MCTRYYMEMSAELRPIIEEAKQASLTCNMIYRLGKALKTEGEIRPADMVPVIAPGASGKQKVFPMVWGFRYHLEVGASCSRPDTGSFYLILYEYKARLKKSSHDEGLVIK